MYLFEFVLNQVLKGFIRCVQLNIRYKLIQTLYKLDHYFMRSIALVYFAYHNYGNPILSRLCMETDTIKNFEIFE